MTDRDPPGKDDLERSARAVEAASGHPRAEEFVNLFKRGLRFSEELLAENERLRFQLASLESKGGAAPSPVVGEEGGSARIAALQEEVRRLEEEKQRLSTSFQAVEEKNRDYQVRYAEIEEEHNNLANLYIASYQLHASLDFREVVRVIAEIVINLIGVQRFTLFMLDESSGVLHPVFGEGQDPAQVPPAKLGEGPIGEAVAAGEPRVYAGEGQEPVAVVPLATLEGKVGAVVIDELLVQKQEITRVDHELFTLLGAHAATALLGGLLRARDAGEQPGFLLDIAHIRKLLES